MALYAQTVNSFIEDCYQLISASTPTVPLQGNDLQKGIQIANELVKFYSSDSLVLTISKEITFTVSIGQQAVTFADPTYTPAANVQQGRLSNLQNAWLELDGVTYPLIDESRNVFFGSYKFDPQEGLPRFCIIKNDLNLTTMRIYPSPSQVYNMHVYGKFEMPFIVSGGDMSQFPLYFYRFLKLAVARDLAFYKGRSSAWSEQLQAMYDEAWEKMESVSSMNLVIDSANESYLNGSWRLRAGV